MPSSRRRRRVNTGFSPLNVSGLVAWYDFSDAATLFTDAGTTQVSADGQSIYQANDKGSNGHNVAQTVVGQRPVYKVNIQNGKSVGRFVAASTQFLTKVTTPATSQPFTGFAVANGTTGAARVIWGSTGSNCHMAMSATDKLDIYAGGTAGSGATSIAGAFHVCSGLWNDASSQGWTDGVAHAAASAGTSGLIGVNLGVFGDDVQAPMQGDIGEVIAYDTSLSSTNRRLVEAYLGAKWNVTVA